MLMAKRFTLSLSDLTRVGRYIVQHPANRERKVRQIARSVGFRVAAGFGRQVSVPLGQHSRIWASLSHASTILAAYANPPDWAEWVYWKKELQPGDLFVDIGANVGIYSILAAELGCRVIAFEPDLQAVSTLRRNLELNNCEDRVTIVTAAVTDQDGCINFAQGQDALGYLGQNSTTNLGLETRCARLDSEIHEEIAGLKIDVEGAELAVLMGAKALLASRKVKRIQVEWNDRSRVNFGTSRQPLAQFLTDHGFELTRPDDEGNLHPWDGEEGSDVIALLGSG